MTQQITGADGPRKGTRIAAAMALVLAALTIAACADDGQNRRIAEKGIGGTGRADEMTTPSGDGGSASGAPAPAGVAAPSMGAGTPASPAPIPAVPGPVMPAMRPASPDVPSTPAITVPQSPPGR